jgi:tetratricopeptide (TPR) repeat protein
VDLFNQLSLLHKEQYKNREGKLIVYRGQMMFRDELTKLKQNIGHLISINTFLSTSTACAVAINFSGNGEHQSMGIVSVIFEISIDLAVPCRPFANIDQLSFIEDEREILFSIGTIFQIDSVDLETDTIWLVKLSWTNEVSEKLKEMKQLTELLDFYTNQNIGDHPSILTFGLFLSKMGLLREATRFYIYLRKTLPPDHPDRGVLHNNLGEVLRKRNYLNQARFEFEEALEYCADTLSIYHPFWAILHSNIALLDLMCRRPKQALKCYRCALLTITKSYDLNDWGTIYIQERLATIYHGMGSAHYFLQQFQQALEFHQKALEIELRVLPRDHPTLVDSYNDLGNVHAKLNHWTQALENLEESLRIAQQNLLINDERLVIIHLSIAVFVYHINRNISKILIHCSHAQQLIDQSTLPSTSYNRMEVYTILAHLYTHIGLGQFALKIWEQFIKPGKNRLIADSAAVNVSNLISQMKTLELLKQNSNEDWKYMIFNNSKYSTTPSLFHLEAIARCGIADDWRAMGYIQQAIYYYTWLLENFPTLDDSHFNKVHKSRLHNNLAACYQDLDDDQKALKHYHLSLDILSPDDKHKSMEAAIIYYNIALIYTNCNELDEARMHLHKSLSHIPGSTSNQNSSLGVQIYIAFAKTYERSNDWEMAREYYQRTIDQVIQGAPDHPIINKYKEKLQYVIDKINEST